MDTHRWAYQPSHPTYARILAGATLGVLFAPAATILAIVTGHTLWAQVGVLATTAAYPVGFCAALWRYRQRNRAAIAEAQHEAQRDPLTGLPTRAVADRLLQAATRDGTPMTVALADIDGLNAINSLGHAAVRFSTRTVRRHWRFQHQCQLFSGCFSEALAHFSSTYPLGDQGPNKVP